MAKKARAASTGFDEASHTPLIAEQAQKLESFLTTMADGKVDVGEIKAQEERLVALMKEVEPLLDEKTHEKVTRLLCELTAYDLMQMTYALQQARPKTVFHG